MLTLDAIGPLQGSEWSLLVPWAPFWEVLEVPWAPFEVTWCHFGHFGWLGHLK